MFWDMNCPHHFLVVNGDEFLDVQSFARQIRASFCQLKDCFWAVIVIGVRTDNLQSLAMHIHRKKASLHVDDGRHLGNHIEHSLMDTRGAGIVVV